ncbi:MAG: dephospho-CoA kinase [Prevotella sp.]|nr:dephospho-CoA kinase [Prevotella sp.]
MKTAITGGIGSGKSFVCRLLAQQGISVYDCDAAAKRLMRQSPTLRRQLTDLIGSDTYGPDGQLNKAAVSRFLLASPDNTAAINAIVHPAVMADFDQSGQQWLESAILFDARLDHLFPRIVAVIAPLEVRLQRIMQRDGITRQQAQEWIDRQLSQEEVARRAHHVIVNDGQRPLLPQLLPLLKAP